MHSCHTAHHPSVVCKMCIRDRDYKDQPGGQFKFDKFYKQIAVADGLGLRLDLDFFVLRFDGGMKAINPAYDCLLYTSHFIFFSPIFNFADAAISCGIISLLLFYSKYLNDVSPTREINQ